MSGADADERDGQLLDADSGCSDAGGSQLQAVGTPAEGDAHVFGVSADLAEVALGINRRCALGESHRALLSKVDNDDGLARLGVVGTLDGEGVVSVLVAGGKADGARRLFILFDVYARQQRHVGREVDGHVVTLHGERHGVVGGEGDGFVLEGGSVGDVAGCQSQGEQGGFQGDVLGQVHVRVLRVSESTAA